MKGKHRFFAKHAKSSAMLISLGIHAGIVLIALTFVVITVVGDKDPGFVTQEFKRPQMPPRKIQVPVKIEKQKTRIAKLKKIIVSRNPERTTANIQIPETTGILSGFGTLNAPSGLGRELGILIPEINFFNLRKKSEKVVFVVLAGPASTSGADGYQSPKSRMCFYTLRARLNDMVAKLPEYALFNATFFMAQITTPFSTKMVLATEENKALLADWASTVNPLELEETYGPGNHYEGFWDRFTALDWEQGERWEGDDVPPVYPKWVYRYNPGPHIQKHYSQGTRAEREFIHVNRAICFALEQKPDTIFILTTNYIGVDPAVNAQSYLNICKDLYGPDRRKYPSINVVVMARTGRSTDSASSTLSRYTPIINTFRGQGTLIEDIRDYMTDEERVAMEAMEGTF
jgi:hypothetical protein